MKQIITAKLKLHTDSAQFQALRKAQLTYRDALNYVSQYSFAHGKISNQRRLQEACYDKIRSRFQLPSQMACNITRQVGATYKTLWTKVKQNNAARQAGFTKKRYKGLDRAPKYVSPTLTYNYQRDYTFKNEQQVSLLTLSGRIVVSYSGYNKHIALIQDGAPRCAAKLWYDKPRKQFYLLVCLELEVPDPTPQSHPHVIGVDVGQRYLAVVATPQNKTKFYSGKQVRAKADHYARMRKRLQKKGTRHAIRRAFVISGRERRLKQAANHLIASRIVDAHPHSVIGLEDLTHIRERTKRRTHKRKKNGKGYEKVGRSQRKSNRHASSWAFAELHSYIAYKAVLSGSMAIKVDANYTSKACPMCGYTADENRPHKGLLFVCQSCHYTLHADLVGARNITMRTLLTRQDWMSTGLLSVAPDGSSDEAKAARLSRYAELRWSPDPSPRPSGAGY